jgi:hypothetical protein
MATAIAAPAPKAIGMQRKTNIINKPVAPPDTPTISQL